MSGPVHVERVREAIEASDAGMREGNWIDDEGLLLRRVHDVSQECLLHGCAIHNPTDPRPWPRRWNYRLWIMMRVCPCGVEHPDLNEVSWRKRHGIEYDWSQHTCCGHCDHFNLCAA